MNGRESENPGTYRLANDPEDSDEYPVEIQSDSAVNQQRDPGSKTRGKAGRRKSIFTANLPLETETSRFILVNALDLFMTFLLLYFSNRGLLTNNVVESNPVADFFIKRWNTTGLVFFKFSVIAFVVVVAQIVARKKPKTAKMLLDFGALLVGAVVVYSVLIMLRTRI